MHTRKKPKILLIHNVIAPYRLPLFEKLNELLDLSVFFCKESREGRKWQPSLTDYFFKKEVIREIDWKGFFINFSLPLKLLSHRYDVYGVGENRPVLFSSLFTLFFTKILRKPFIIWSETIETDFFGKNLEDWREFSLQFLYDQADAFVAHSQMSRDFLIKRGAPASKIFTGAYIMPKELLPEVAVKKKRTKYRGKKVILSLGYLQKRKGNDYLIKAFKQLNLENTELIIAGSGPEERRLKSLAGDCKHIHFPGYVRGKEKAKYYSIADVFVLPTLHDPWGLVINEALYYGTPVITTEAAGGKDLIKERENGLIIPPRSVRALKKSLESILQEKTLRRMKENVVRYPSGTEVREGIKPFLKAIKEVIS